VSGLIEFHCTVGPASRAVVPVTLAVIIVPVPGGTDGDRRTRPPWWSRRSARGGNDAEVGETEEQRDTQRLAQHVWGSRQRLETCHAATDCASALTMSYAIGWSLSA
jgi:hypothetical protein